MRIKAQSAVEFTILVGVVLLLFSIFLGALQQANAEKNAESTTRKVQEVAEDIQVEMTLAAGASDGYYRTFTVPQRINAKDYSATVIGTTLYLNTTDNRYTIALIIPQVSGQLVKGTNTIKKNNNTVQLN